MRDFLQKYWRVGAIALILSGVMVFALSGYLAPYLRIVVDPVVGAQRWLATRYLALFQMARSPADVTALLSQNEQLKNENALLRSQVIQLQEQQKDNDVL